MMIKNKKNSRTSDKRGRVRRRGEENVRFREEGGGYEKPGCRVSAPASAACCFSCAGELASSPCSHAIVTPSVRWHDTITLQLKASQILTPPPPVSHRSDVSPLGATADKLRSQLVFPSNSDPVATDHTPTHRSPHEAPTEPIARNSSEAQTTQRRPTGNKLKERAGWYLGRRLASDKNLKQ